MEEIEYKVYVRRHFVLLSYSLTMAAWNLNGLRHTSIVPSYAHYHGITNEVSAPPVYGVDMFALASNVVALFSYIPASYAVDKWGLRCITLGSFFIALTAWAWYFSGTNTLLVLLSIVVAAIFGPLVSTSLLAVSNRWYAPHERAKATAVGGLVGNLGGALAFVVSPLFATQSKEVVALTLRSCRKSAVAAATLAQLESMKSAGEEAVCEGRFLALREQFCCYLPVNVGRLNLVMAIVSTVTFLFTLVSVRSLPPTPPAASGAPKSFAGIWPNVRKVCSEPRFMQLTLSDFLVSGPPLVLLNTMSRVFPAEISSASRWASVAGTALAVPLTVVAGHMLDRTKAFWTFSVGGYSTGTVLWAVGTASMASGTVAGAYVFAGAVTLALAAYMAWQTAIFETKLEYVFSAHTSLEGIVVATDRFVINLSSLIFLSAIPPERVGSAQTLFYIGLAIMAVGCLPTALIRKRYNYQRLRYDKQGGDFGNDEGAESTTSGDTVVKTSMVDNVTAKAEAEV